MPALPENPVPTAQHRRVPLRLFLRLTFGRRQSFCGFLSVAGRLQVGLITSALLGQALVFALA